MPTVQIPLTKGQGKSKLNADYLDLLPVNILPVARQVGEYAGYHRFYRGLDKISDVDGVSRGSQYNVAESSVYRAMGGELYANGVSIGNVPNSDRVSMACSRTSQAVSTGGELLLYRYDGTVKTFENWPEKEGMPERTDDIFSDIYSLDDNSYRVPLKFPDNERITTEIQVRSVNGILGEPLTLTPDQIGVKVSQEKPEGKIPHITDAVFNIVDGVYTLEFTYHGNLSGGARGNINVTQFFPSTIIENPQYEWGKVGDVCRLRGRYIFAQEGTDTFWISDLEDESKPDLIAPAYRAESQPDGILAVREWNDYLLTFGSSTVEYYRLTGNSNQVFQSQPSYMLQVGIAGRFAVTSFLNTFAFITNASSGKFQVALMGQGNYQIISDAHIDKVLAEYTSEQLNQVFIESVKFDDHDLLIIHLPNETLIFDAMSKMWGQIKTGKDTHRAVDYQSIGNSVTVGDKQAGIYGELTDLKSSQYNEQAEILLYSPMLSMPEMCIDRLSIVSNISTTSTADYIALSVTQDGVIWSPERIIRNDEPLKWINTTILDLVGEVRGQIGFRLRIVGANPTTLSGFEMEVY